MGPFFPADRAALRPKLKAWDIRNGDVQAHVPEGRPNSGNTPDNIGNHGRPPYGAPCSARAISPDPQSITKWVPDRRAACPASARGTNLKSSPFAVAFQFS